MKKKIYPVIFWAWIFVFFFSGCTTSPDWVMKRFTKRWFKGELDKTKPYLAPESRKYVDWLKNIKSPEELEQMNKTKVKLKVIDVTKQNDSTRSYHCEVTLNEEKQVMDIDLKRLKHRWFVDIAN